MKRSIRLLLGIWLVSMCLGCPKDTEDDTVTGYHGYLFYTVGSDIYRLNLDLDVRELLFTNGKDAVAIGTNRLLLVEPTPDPRIIVSDFPGANRKSVLEYGGLSGPKHRKYFEKPQMSPNQKYIAYDGDVIYNPETYIVDANTGELLATAGDWNASKPLISPSWSPDGSLFVCGWSTLNNGIFKIAPDFGSIVRIDPNLTNVSAPSVSPDGTKVAFIRDGKLWTMNSDGTNATLWNSGKSNFYTPAWSPDGKYIVVISGGIINVFDPALATFTEIGSGYYASSGSQMSWKY